MQSQNRIYKLPSAASDLRELESGEKENAGEIAGMISWDGGLKGMLEAGPAFPGLHIQREEKATFLRAGSCSHL